MIKNVDQGIKSLEERLSKVKFIQHISSLIEEFNPNEHPEFDSVYEEVSGKFKEFSYRFILELTKPLMNPDAEPPKIAPKSTITQKSEDLESFRMRNEKFGGKIIRGLIRGKLVAGTAISMRAPHVVIETKDEGNQLIHENDILDKEQY